MNLKALITTLVIGSSSAAMADSTVTVNASLDWSAGYRTRGPVIRDHRIPTSTQVRDTRWRDRPVYQQPVVQAPRFSNVKQNSDSSEYTGPIYTSNQRGHGWSVITDPTHIELDRQIIRVNGQFNSLALQRMSGSSTIKMVKVRFADGRADQTLVLNRSLSTSQSTINLAVQRAPIEYIVVYGSTPTNASYRLLGS